MRRSDRSRGVFSALAAVAAIGALAASSSALAGDAASGAQEKGRFDPAKYEIIKHIDPFSPLPPKKPEPPPVPKKPEPPPEPPKMVKVKPDNLHLAGATWDNSGGFFVAMIEVDGQGTRFVKVGEKVGALEILEVDLEGAVLKDSEGNSRKVVMGTRFHDGVTIVERLEGGGPAAPGPAPAASAAGSTEGPAPTLDEARKREIIERLKAKRAEAARAKAQGK